jgi:hypothetical protein
VIPRKALVEVTDRDLRLLEQLLDIFPHCDLLPQSLLRSFELVRASTIIANWR